MFSLLLRRLIIGITAADERLFRYKCVRRVWSVSRTADTDRRESALVYLHHVLSATDFTKVCLDA